jgi:hypothetical protein
MATVDKAMANVIAAKQGYYADDPRVHRIIEYTNAWGGTSYGIEYAHEIGRYAESEFVRSPSVYWEAS